MSVNKILIILATIGGLFIIYSVVGFVYSMHQVEVHKRVEPIEVYADSVIKEYILLIPSAKSATAHSWYSYISNSRRPFSKVDIKNNCLIISKIEDTSNLPLTYIQVRYEKSYGGSSDSVYNGINEEYFNVLHLVSSPGHIEHIYFSVGGDSVDRVVIDDSTVKFHCIAGSFSIQYHPEGPVDIYGLAKHNLMMPMDVFFMKRRMALYFALVSTNNLDSTRLIDPFH